MRRGWAERLIETGVATLDGARATLRRRPADRARGRRHAAARRSRRSATRPSSSSAAARPASCCLELLPDQEERGFRLLPEPDAGDVWLDLEGHPFYETARGLEYLFGWCYRDEAGEVATRRSGERDRDGERRAFERFVDWVVERRRRYPGMHVYHYAAYERTALTRLMGEHGTREQEVDEFLRGEVLVDLYRVVKQALRASVDSYSIKAIEKLYGFERTAEVAGGDESVVRFEEWLETGDDALLDEIERYNEEDCRSTVELHEWLPRVAAPDGAVARAAGAQRSGPRRPRSATPSGRRSRRGCSRERRRARRGGCSRTSSTTTSARSARVVGVVSLAAARRRRARRGPHRDRRPRRGTRRPPEVEDKSHAYRMTFPAQEHKISTARGSTRTTQAVPSAGRRRRRRRHAAPRRRSGWTSRSRGADSRPADRGLGQARGAAPLRPRVCGRRPGRYPALTALLEQRVPDARLDVDPVEAALSLARQLPLRPGAARLGQDLAGRADGGRADARREARRRHLAQPQGDPQPAARDRARGRRAGLRVPRRQAGARRGGVGDGVREPLHRHVRPTSTSVPTRPSTSSPAPAGR